MPKNYTSSQLPPGRFQYGAPWSGRFFFVGLLLLTTLFFLPSQLSAQRMWINEFHYDNVSIDVDEFIEVVVEDGADLSQITVVRYDGNGTVESGTLNVQTQFTQGDDENCFTIYWVAINLENETEGIALIYQGVVVEFISYEGSFMASNGPAAGYVSVDVGVQETGATPAGFSLQRTGTGINAGDFSWTGPSADSPGSLNTGQDFSDPNIGAQLTDTPENGEPAAPGDKIKYTAVIANTGNGAAKGVSLDRMAPTDPNTTLVPGSFSSTPIGYDAYVINVPEDAVNFPITLSGFDPDGDLLTYTINTPTTNGSLGAVAPAGPTAGSATVNYTPNANYFGPDMLTFTVTDDDNNPCPATIHIMVQPVNDPPTITCGPNQSRPNSVGGATELNWATGISVGPTSPPAPNGDESAFQTATITTVADVPSLFSVQPLVDAAGTLTYTPAGGASGLANVTVTISDGVFADDVSCSFTITIQSFPDAMDDNFTTVEDTDLNGEDLFADNGNGVDDLGFPAGVITGFGGGDAPGGAGTNAPGAMVAFAGGTLQVNANGTFSLTGQPFTLGTYNFFYTLDNGLNVDVAEVTITINPADLAPTVVSHTPANNSVDIAVDTDVTVTFSEPVNAGAAAFTLVGANSGAHTFVLAGGPTVFTLNPDVDFDNFEQVTLTVVAANVTDVDAADPPDNMAADFVCVFTTIGIAPVCTNDGPAANSAPGDDFHTALNTTLNAADGTSEDLLTNDILGIPAAVITEFGPTGAVGTNAGTPGASANGGTLTVNANGSFSYTPPNNFTGLDVFFYELENINGTVVCQATVAVGARPVCTNGSAYSGTGNIAISINAASGFLSDDTGDQLVVEQIQGSGANIGVATAATNGTVTAQSDGSFIFDPAADATTGSFTYTVDNGFNDPQTCTVTINFTQMIWFVDVNGSGTNVGTFLNPFQTIAAFNASGGPSAGDFISLSSGTYSEADGINLQDNQTLIGEGVQLDNFFTAHANSIAAYHTFAAGTSTRPVISTTIGTNNGIDLERNNTIRGLNIGNTGGWGMQDGGVNAGALTIADVSITGTGGGVNIFNGGTLAVSFDEISSSGPLFGINLQGGISGDFDVSTGTLSTSGVGVQPVIIITGAPSVDLGINLVSASTDGYTGTGVSITNTTGSFTVTGTGTTDGSGGTIQNCGNDGINITKATNITLSNMNVSNNGNAANEHGIEMTNVTGIVDFNNIDVSFSADKNVEIFNNAGSLTFTADDCIFRDTQSSGTGADGLEIIMSSSASATIDIDDCQFLRNRTNGIQVFAEQGADITQCDITTCTIDSEAGIGIGLDLGANNAGSTLNFNVIGNPRIRSRSGPAVNVDGSNGASIQGRINDNPDIQAQSGAGSGIFADCNENSTVVLEVDNNTVQIGTNEYAMTFRSRLGAGRMDVTVTDNSLTIIGSSFYDLELLTDDSNTLCGDIRDNTASGVGLFGAAYRLREASGTLLLDNFMTNGVTTLNNGNNTPMNSVSESPGGSVSSGTCTTVSHPLP